MTFPDLMSKNANELFSKLPQAAEAYANCKAELDSVIGQVNAFNQMGKP